MELIQYKMAATANPLKQKNGFNILELKFNIIWEQIAQNFAISSMIICNVSLYDFTKI